MVAGLVVAAIGMAMLAVIDTHLDVIYLEIGLAVVGAGAGLMSSSMSNLAVSSVPSKHTSTASAAHNTFRQIGATLGVAGIGAVIAVSQRAHANASRFAHGLGVAFSAIAAVLVASAITAFVLTRRPGMHDDVHGARDDTEALRAE